MAQAPFPTSFNLARILNWEESKGAEAPWAIRTCLGADENSEATRQRRSSYFRALPEKSRSALAPYRLKMLRDRSRGDKNIRLASRRKQEYGIARFSSVNFFRGLIFTAVASDCGEEDETTVAKEPRVETEQITNVVGDKWGTYSPGLAKNGTSSIVAALFGAFGRFPFPRRSGKVARGKARNWTGGVEGSGLECPKETKRDCGLRSDGGGP
ncbi:hypothetical protein KM043_006660 [Ampulex compressa]|nr:hypothetical protein KM043_006660 [Ampulex compressa]